MIEDHLNQFNTDDKKVLGVKDSMSIEEQINQVFSNVYLKRVGIYPGNEETFGIFDYSINPDLTQYLFVIETDCFGKITSEKVFIES